MRYFGVRANSLCLLNSASNTARVLLMREADADRHQERHVLQPRAPVVVNLALADHVEVAEREGRREEQRHVDEQHLVPAHVVADHHGREHQHRQHAHQDVVEVRRQVEERLGLDAERHDSTRRIRGSSLRQVWIDPFAQRCCCDLKAFISTGTSAGAITSGHEDEPPAAQLRAVAEIEILGERVVLPAAGVVDGRPAPDAGRAVEVEEAPAAVAAAVLEDEMAVEQDRLDLREQRVVLVDVPPARLHHPDLRHRAKCGIRRVRKSAVGMKSASKMAMNSPRATFRPASSAPALYPVRFGAVEVLDVDALRGEAAHRQLGDAARLVGRVVEHLDLEQLARIVDAADRLDQAVGDVHFVVERQLDRDDRQRVERRAGRRLLVPVPHVEVHEVIAMPAVNGEDDQDEEVGGEGERFSGRHVLRAQ